jgi:hypothetical protein
MPVRMEEPTPEPRKPEKRYAAHIAFVHENTNTRVIFS